MNITLKEGRKDHLGGKLNISATQFGANVEGPISDNGSFLFSARRSYLDLIFKAAGFGFVPEYWDFIGKATFNIDRSNEISFLTIGVLDKVRFFMTPRSSASAIRVSSGTRRISTSQASAGNI